MTQPDMQKLEMEVVHKAETAKRDLRAHTIKLALVGETLEKFGRALQDCPMVITPVPEIDAPDYRKALNLLHPDLCREVIGFCQSIKDLQSVRDAAERKKASLGF
jgi:hypothetical protein